ncbi:MAG: hypothetical protein ACPG5O_10045 [Pseudoalteromonas tetraodonis]
MAVSASALIQPVGRIAPDLIPRTPDEVEAGTYATDTAKTAAHVAAFIAAAPEAADTDARVTAYVYWRAYEARADVMEDNPASGDTEGEGSYTYTAAQIAAARARAERFEAAYQTGIAAVARPLARGSVVLEPVVRW